MNRKVSDYLDHVCVQIKLKQIRLSTRAELSGHIQMLIDDFQQSGLDEQQAIEAALKRMGNPDDIGKKIASFNVPWQNMLTTVVGVMLIIAVFMWQDVIYFFDLSAFLFVVLLTLALLLIGGFSRMTWLSALTRGRVAALFSGGIGMIIGIIQMLNTIGNPDQMGPALSLCITCVLYGLLVSAVLTSVAHLCRPLEGHEIRRILGWEDIVP